MTRTIAVGSRRKAPSCLGAAALAFVSVAVLSGQQRLEVKQDGRYWTAQRSAEEQAASVVEIDTKGQVMLVGSEIETIRFTLTMRLPAVSDKESARAVLRDAGIVPSRKPGGTLVLTLREPGCNACRFDARLEIEVPTGTGAVDIVTRGGAVGVQDIEGSVRVRTSGGSITMSGVGGAVLAATAGGSVRLGTVGGPVDCVTAGGSINLADSGKSARLKTIGGGIRVANVNGDLEAETAGGSIEVGNVSGTVRAITGGGSIRVVEARHDIHADAGAGDIRIDRAMGALVVSSGAGDILASFQRGSGLRDSVLETSVGSIVVSLPESLALTIDASVRLARGMRGIISEFPSIQVNRFGGPFGPASVEAAGAINGGGATLTIRNGVGRIEVRKLR